MIQFVDLLARPQRREAIQFVTRLAEDGIPPGDLILGLLAPAELEVGARWQRREWNVAREHAATAVVDAALAVLALERELEPTAGRAVVACVEGEWHSLPARMAAELLRLEGWDVTVLGPSLPADDLAAHVHDLAPDVVGVSCSVPLFLTGAQRSIAACLDAGAPVVAGGAGFGDGGRYAAALGATGWVADPRSLARVLAGGTGDGGPTATVADPGGSRVHLLLEAERPDLVAGALDAVTAGGGLAGAGRARVELREALDALAVSVENACLVDDPRVVTQCIPVVDRLLPDELAGRVSATELLERLLPELRQRAAHAGDLAAAGLRAAADRPPPA